MTLGKLSTITAMLLISICAGLAYAIFEDLNTHPTLPPIKLAGTPSSQTAGPTPNGANSVGLPTVSQLSAITDRPLFFQSRTIPEPPPGEPAGPTTQPKLGVTVSGVIITPTMRVALVRSPESKEVLLVSEGEKVGEWQMSQITPDSVFLQWRDKTEVIAVEDNVAPTQTKGNKKRVGQNVTRARGNAVQRGKTR